MKTITMTAHDRPNYLKQTLSQFATTNSLDGVDKMFFGVEPGNKEVLDLCRSMQEKVPTHITVNPGKLGVSRNPYMTLRRAFKAGSTLNLYLEDDVLFSPDVIKMMDWYDSIPNKNDFLCMSLFRQKSLKDLSGVRTESNSNKFSALGLLITDYQWENYFAPNWFKDKRGWDWSIRNLMTQTGLEILVPKVSRSYHIGREKATHYVPAVHDKVHLGVEWHQADAKQDYVLEIQQKNSDEFLDRKRTGISVVIPYKHNTNRPEDTLRLCIKSWLEQEKKPDYVIVADGSLTPIDLTSFGEHVIHKHVPFKGDFNLSFLRNVGIRAAIDAGSEHVQIMDNDIFPQSKDHLAICLDLMKATDIVMPFVANSETRVPLFESTGDKSYIDFVNQELKKIKVQRFSYSTMFLKLSVPIATNGFCELFEKWGGEDDAFIHMALRMGFKAKKMKSPLLMHSYHEQDTQKSAKSGDSYQRNLDLLRKVRSGKITPHDLNTDWGMKESPRVG